MKKLRKGQYIDEQIEYLREIGHKTDRTNKEITKMFNEKFNENRTVAGIVGAKSKNGIRSFTKAYTKKEVEYLKKIKSGKSHEEITKMFNEKFGANRTVSSIKSIMWERNILLDDDGRFKKGFKPKNTLPIGTEIRREDGYLYVKVAEPNIWKQKHRIIWEEHYGKVLDDHVILFGDRNVENFDIDNLMLVTRSQLAILNKQNLIQEDIDSTKAMIGVVKIIEKISELEKGDKNG